MLSSASSSPRALHASDTGLLDGRTDLVSPFEAVTDFLGLPAYRDLEEA
jgi:hypothetical protein